MSENEQISKTDFSKLEDHKWRDKIEAEHGFAHHHANHHRRQEQHHESKINEILKAHDKNYGDVTLKSLDDKTAELTKRLKEAGEDFLGDGDNDNVADIKAQIEAMEELHQVALVKLAEKIEKEKEAENEVEISDSLQTELGQSNQAEAEAMAQIYNNLGFNAKVTEKDGTFKVEVEVPLNSPKIEHNLDHNSWAEKVAHHHEDRSR